MNRQSRVAILYSVAVLVVLIVLACFIVYHKTQDSTTFNQTLELEPPAHTTEDKAKKSDEMAISETTDGWVVYSTKKPLNITFSAPKDFLITGDDDVSESWSVNLSSSAGLTISMCTGCQNIPSMLTCYPTGNFEDENNCELQEKKTLPNGDYKIYRIKQNFGGGFAHIEGNLEKQDSFRVLLRVTTTDNRMPTETEMQVLDRIISSVK